MNDIKSLFSPLKFPLLLNINMSFLYIFLTYLLSRFVSYPKELEENKHTWKYTIKSMDWCLSRAPKARGKEGLSHYIHNHDDSTGRIIEF